MRHLLILLASLSLLACSPGDQSATRPNSPVPPVPIQPLVNHPLQGSWIVTYNEVQGKALPDMVGELFIFKDDQFRLGSDRETNTERFSVDDVVSPKCITFDLDHPPLVLGIYKLEGDTLTICSAAPGDPRPTDFKTSPSSSAVLTHLKKK